MEFLNIAISDLQKPEYVGSDPKERATWLNLSAWCARVENGGRIVGCRQWKCRQWQQTCGVTLKETQADCDLWTWDGDDMVMWNYPAPQEAKVQAQRERARTNGKNGGRPPNEPNPEPRLEPTSVSTSEPTSENERERKGKEGKEKEGKRNGNDGAAPVEAISLPLDLNIQVAEISIELHRLFPAAPEAMPIAERNALIGVMPVFLEFTGTDWRAAAAWVTATPAQRSLTHKPRYLWPRGRGEFIANVAEAIEQIRDWWKKKGRKTFEPLLATTKEPEPQPMSPEDRAEVVQLWKSLKEKTA